MDITIMVKATDQQRASWRAVAGLGEPDLGAFLARAADFYAARLQARRELALRMKEQGKL